MRGSPVLQSIIVLLVLVILAVAGVDYISNPDTGQAVKKSSENAATPEGEHRVELEIFFSETPVKYMLRRPDENSAILTAKELTTNPALHEYSLRSKNDTVLWLDVTWPDSSIGKRNFVQVIATVNDLEPEVFTFHDVTKVLQGTMEFKSLTDHEH